MTPPSFSMTGLPRSRRALGAGPASRRSCSRDARAPWAILRRGRRRPRSGRRRPCPSGGVARGIDMPGAPKFHRFVRLTNSQWARSVQVVLNLADPSSLSDGFEKPVSGITDFTNNEHLLEREPALVGRLPIGGGSARRGGDGFGCGARQGLPG